LCSFNTGSVSVFLPSRAHEGISAQRHPELWPCLTRFARSRMGAQEHFFEGIRRRSEQEVTDCSAESAWGASIVSLAHGPRRFRQKLFKHAYLAERSALVLERPPIQRIASQTNASSVYSRDFFGSGRPLRSFTREHRLRKLCSTVWKNEKLPSARWPDD